MLHRPNLFDVPYWGLVLRYPTQVAFLVLIAWTNVVWLRIAVNASPVEYSALFRVIVCV